MTVRSCGPAGVSDSSDAFAVTDFLTDGYVDLGVMTIAGFNSIPMIYNNKFSVTGVVAGKSNNPVCRSEYRCSRGRSNIKSLVHHWFIGIGRNSVPKPRRVPTIYRFC